MSPREIDDPHTEQRDAPTPSQRRALRRSLSTSAEIVMVIAGLSAMMSAARLAGSRSSEAMKNRL